MSEYQRPIQVEADDPICSASGLEGTVIGVLFDKKGSEIKQAIEARVSVIDTEVSKYDKITGEVKNFLNEKADEIKKIEQIYTDREDEKQAKAKPHTRKIEEIQKEWNDEVFTFDKETEKKVAGEAVDFEKGFEKFEDAFEDVDKIIEEDTLTLGRSMQRSATKGFSTTSTSSSSGQSFSSNSLVCESADSFYISEVEDKALARLNTLKDVVRGYTNKVKNILGKVNNLKEEKRRLNLIGKNIQADNTYKLDLNKLSAFGFENINIA